MFYCGIWDLPSDALELNIILNLTSFAVERNQPLLWPDGTRALNLTFQVVLISVLKNKWIKILWWGPSIESMHHPCRGAGIGFPLPISGSSQQTVTPASQDLSPSHFFRQLHSHTSHTPIPIHIKINLLPHHSNTMILKARHQTQMLPTHHGLIISSKHSDTELYLLLSTLFLLWKVFSNMN